MGMYDNINYKCDCPYCGKSIDDFQSKDGKCILNTIEPEDVYHFYTSCSHCREWVAYDVLDIEPLELKLLKSLCEKEPKRKSFKLNGRAIVKNISGDDLEVDFVRLKTYILTQKHGIDLTDNGYSEKFDCWFSKDEYEEN